MIDVIHRNVIIHLKGQKSVKGVYGLRFVIVFLAPYKFKDGIL